MSSFESTQNESFQQSPAILVGFDLGTNTTCVIASKEGSKEILFKRAFPTVVGYAKESMMTGILPGDNDVYFGSDAHQFRSHLNLVSPLKDGVIGDLKAAKEFVKYIRECIDPTGAERFKAVIGIPADTSAEAKENIREVVSGIFDQIMLVPEPFLAALGFRNEQMLQDSSYVDPIRHSLVIDIGAGTTDLCLIQGFLPTADNLVCVPFAGDNIDAIISDGITSQYPETDLNALKIRSIKENYSYVGPLKKDLEIKILVGGRSRYLEVGPVVGQACNQLLEKIKPAVIELIENCPSDSVEAVMRNIIMTGGGSRIGGIAEELQRLLEAEGFESPRVATVGEHYKGFVALGAWKAAQTAKPNQWQHLLRKTAACVA